MKRCELIRNITAFITLALIGVAVIGGVVMEPKESVVVLLTALFTGSVSYTMDKISHEKS